MHIPWFAHVLLRRAGVDIIPWPNRPDAHLVDWAIGSLIETQNINCVLDVGANEGQFGQLVRLLGYHGRIVSFEPSPVSFQKLNQLASRDDSWQTRQVGLAAKPGTAELYMHGASVFDSLHPSLLRRTELPDVIEAARGYANTRTSTVTLSTLADEYENAVAGISNPRVLLKSDTQGHDLDVIKGAQGLPKHVVAILVELSVQPIYEDQPCMTQVIDRLKEEDFIPILFGPVTPLFDKLRVVEFDGVFVRQHKKLA
jgi:FkbM family methyltransferase